jgi:hypothetical protein
VREHPVLVVQALLRGGEDGAWEAARVPIDHIAITGTEAVFPLRCSRGGGLCYSTTLVNLRGHLCVGADGAAQSLAGVVLPVPLNAVGITNIGTDRTGAETAPGEPAAGGIHLAALVGVEEVEGVVAAATEGTRREGPKGGTAVRRVPSAYAVLPGSGFQLGGNSTDGRGALVRIC